MGHYSKTAGHLNDHCKWIVQNCNQHSTHQTKWK